MQFHILGSLEVVHDQVPLSPGGHRERAVLALLLLHANSVVSTDTLIDELWSSEGGKDRKNSLWVAISRLRTLLEPDREKGAKPEVLLTKAPGYLLSIDPDQVDSHRFERLAAEGQALIADDPAAASIILTDSLALWRGRAYEEFTYEPFAEAEIARLEEIRLVAVEDRFAAELALGRGRELVGELEGLVRQHRFRERLTSQLMVALYRSGRQGEALRAFGELQRNLGEELGLEPSKELQALEEQILLDDSTLRPAGAEHHAPQREIGLSVRGYELRSVLQETAAGVVHNAYQPVVGREVAVEVVPDALADEADFIRLFEESTRRVARLDHPGITPIYDFWREPGSAYVVSRRFDRGSMRDALDTDALDLGERIRCMRQVTEALDVAHIAGVQHGAVVLENVMLDAEGNAVLANFTSGLASTANDESDVDQLAAMVRTVLELSVDEPRDLDAIRRALVTASGDEVLDSSNDPDAPNPYVGLRAFGEDDADLFYGRERVVDRLVSRIGSPGARGKFLSLVGPSGSGKSSVIRAGVLPALRAGAVADSDRWFIVSMTPGRFPFESLAEALRSIAVDPPDSLTVDLRERGIADAVRSCTPDTSTQVLILVDQMEELFSHTAEDEREQFMDALAAVANDPRGSVKIITTLRADFYDHPLRHRLLGEILRTSTEVITPMTAEELEQAAVAPAAKYAVHFDGGLVARMVADSAGQSSALPLLQFALTELFERRTSSRISQSEYRELGGLAAALGMRAEAAYIGLSDAQQSRTRELFLRLVTLGDGSEDTRRRALMSEVVDGPADVVHGAIEVLAENRLLTLDRDAGSRGSTVEIAHEALLTEWPRLGRWIDDSRGNIAAQRQLGLAEADWRTNGRDPDFLFGGGQLARYEGWLEGAPVRLTNEEVEFLSSSTSAVAHTREADRRQVTRLRRLVAGVGLGLLAALIAGGVALSQRDAANEAANDAEFATLIANAAALRAEEPELSLLLALESNRRRPGPVTEQAVLNSLGGVSIGSRVSSLAPLETNQCPPQFPYQKRGIQTAVIDGRLVERDPVTGTITDQGPSPLPCAFGGVFDAGPGIISPDLSQFLVGEDLKTEISLDEPHLPLWITGDRVVGFTLSPDGDSSVVRMWDVATGELISEPTTGGVAAADEAPDGSWLAMSLVRGKEGARGSIEVMRFDTGEILWEFGTAAPSAAMTVDSQTGEIIVAYIDGSVITLDPLTGERLAEVELEDHSLFVAAGVRPDGLVVLVTRSSILLVDRLAGIVDEFPVITELEAAFVRSDGLVVVNESDGEVSTYDIGQTALVSNSYDIGFGVTSVVDGRASVVDAGREIIESIDLTTGERTTTELAAGAERIGAIVAYPEADGEWVVTARHSLVRFVHGEAVNEVYLGSREGFLTPRDSLRVRHGRAGDFYSTIGVHPDGSEEISMVRLGDRDADVLWTIPASNTGRVHPTTDGQLLTIDASGMLQTYDEAGNQIDEYATSLENVLRFMVVDPSTGKIAVTQLGDPGISIIDPITRTVEALPGTDRVLSLGFAAEGSLLVITRLDGDVTLWDVENSRRAGVVWDGTGGIDSEPSWYDPETETVWTTSSGKLIQVPVNPQAWLDVACTVVARELTDQEWSDFVPGSQPQTRAC